MDRADQHHRRGVRVRTGRLDRADRDAPAIFRGIHLDPLAAGNITDLLWLITGYRLAQAVLVVTVGRLGDTYGPVPIYNARFAVFTTASITLPFDPFDAGAGAWWLIASS